MKINVTQHIEGHELSGDRKRGGRLGQGLQKNPRTHLGIDMGSLLCADGKQVSMMAASLNMLPINVQFITPCAETQ
jgi:hypothetical protein